MRAEDRENKSQKVFEPMRMARTEEPVSCLGDNIDVSDDTDGRCQFDWRSKYPREARKEMFWESVYVFFLFFIGLAFIFATWRGWVAGALLLTDLEGYTFNKYMYYSMSGFLGGVVFGIKYFYRVIARGYWHQDRKAWRMMSPFIALAISFVIGVLVESSMIVAQKPLVTPTIISIGFLSGYFADEAVGKMYEIASVIFGKSSVR